MDWEWQATDLEYVVGNYTWKHLAEVSFGMMSAKEERLLGLLTWHKGTLKQLTITGLCSREGPGIVLWLESGRCSSGRWCVHGSLIVAGEDSAWDPPLEGPLKGFTSRVKDSLMRRSEDNPLSFPEAL